MIGANIKGLNFAEGKVDKEVYDASWRNCLIHLQSTQSCDQKYFNF